MEDSEKIKELEGIISELREKIKTLQFESDKNHYIANSRAETINEIYATNIKLIQMLKMAGLLSNRIKNDNVKFKELEEYLIRTFPKILKRKPDSDKHTLKKNENISSTSIGEDGRIYKADHIIDVTIILMEQMKKRMSEILGDSDNIIDGIPPPPENDDF